MTHLSHYELNQIHHKTACDILNAIDKIIDEDSTCSHRNKKFKSSVCRRKEAKFNFDELIYELSYKGVTGINQASRQERKELASYLAIMDDYWDYFNFLTENERMEELHTKFCDYLASSDLNRNELKDDFFNDLVDMAVEYYLDLHSEEIDEEIEKAKSYRHDLIDYKSECNNAFMYRPNN